MDVQDVGRGLARATISNVRPVTAAWSTTRSLHKIAVRLLVGITPAQARSLRSLRIWALDDLVAYCAQPGGVETLATMTEIPHDRLRTWLTHAELCRIPGVGVQYAALLLRAGISSRADLAECDPLVLHNHLMQANQIGRRLCRQIPQEDRLEGWITAAIESMDVAPATAG